MDWNDLKLVLAIHRAGNLKGAAQVMKIDQSTAGRRLAALEANLGAILFVRARSGFSLTDAGEAITAPGQMSSHYAPEASVRLEVTTPRDDEVLLGFGPVAGDLSLSPSGDLTEAAARLFDCLHQLNESGQPIAVAPIPRYGLGLAINDRLARAAAPR